MSWPIILVALGGGYQYLTQKAVSKQQQYDLERQAEIEKLEARDTELDRRERLNKVLSANIQSVASMASSEGSPQSVSLESAKTASQSEASESLSDRIRQDLLKRQARQAKSVGDLRAASTLLNTGLNAARLRDGTKKD